jgi:hypothetical protein
MDRKALVSLLARAKRHVSSQERYRFYPLYSILFPGLLYVSVMWPFDHGVFEAWIAHPWLIVLDRCSWYLALWMGISLGAVGLLREGWIPKLISAAGIWCSLYFALWFLPRALSSMCMDLVSNVFDYFRDWVLFISGGEPGAEATVWACVLLVLWLVMRTPVKIAFRHIFRLQEYAVKRWPELSRLQRPVL